jgi:hypothetical protein
LGLQLGVIRNLALNLDGDNLEELDGNLTELTAAIEEIRAMIAGLPHHLA